MSSQDKDKTEQALEKKSTDEAEKALKKDWMSKEQTIESKNYFTHKRISMPVQIFGGNKNAIFDRVLALKIAMRNPELHDELISEILGDLITGAYQNKLEAYAVSLSDAKNQEAFGKMQRHRQSADNHLISIIKVIQDIKRPPVQVVVKQAEQVNVGEQINQSDKQVNIAKNQQSA